jgi:LysM repeat protein
MQRIRSLLAAFLAAGALTFSAPALVRAAPPSAALSVAPHTLLPQLSTGRVATGCVKTYTVKKNDSWNRIAKNVQVAMSLLLKVNKANTNSMLLIGDVICLPRAAVTEAAARPTMKLKPAKIYSVAQSTAIIREVFPDHLEGRAIELAKRESQLNAANYNGGCCIGLFQLHWQAHRSWMRNIGISSPEQLLDAHINAKAALALYKRSNSWAAWG